MAGILLRRLGAPALIAVPFFYGVYPVVADMIDRITEMLYFL